LPHEDAPSHAKRQGKTLDYALAACELKHKQQCGKIKNNHHHKNNHNDQNDHNDDNNKRNKIAEEERGKKLVLVPVVLLVVVLVLVLVLVLAGVDLVRFFVLIEGASVMKLLALLLFSGW